MRRMTQMTFNRTHPHTHTHMHRTKQRCFVAALLIAATGRQPWPRSASQWQHTWRGHCVHRLANPCFQNNGQLMDTIQRTKLRALTPTHAHTHYDTPTYAYTHSNALTHAQLASGRAWKTKGKHIYGCSVWQSLGATSRHNDCNNDKQGLTRMNKASRHGITSRIHGITQSTWQSLGATLAKQPCGNHCFCNVWLLSYGHWIYRGFA